MIQYKRVATEIELNQLLDLQRRNLKTTLDADTISSQGFVTVQHSYEDLFKMHLIEPSIIATHNDNVVAYIIAMTKASQLDIPVLIPMFEMFSALQYNGLTIDAYQYMVVGQVCVDYHFRGQQIFDKAYAYYKEVFKEKYDFAITEIALENTRSLRAHSRVGFTTIHEYTDSYGIDWAIVLWPFHS